MKMAALPFMNKVKMISPAKPILRELAGTLNIPIVNGNGNQHNTRTLGSLVVNSVVGYEN